VSSYVARHHEFTLGEYFAAERRSGDKHEFADGQIYVMAGGSPRHNYLSGRVHRLLAEGLEGHPCDPLPADQRIGTGDGLYTYADGSVFCGDIELGPEQTALNTVVLIEVLSDSTRTYDRGEKLRRYQSITSLQHVVLLEQDAPDVEVWRRGPAGWTRTVHVEPDDRVPFPAIGVTLRLGDIYAGADRFPG
jgi:Uma2 family endonuclease